MTIIRVINLVILALVLNFSVYAKSEAEEVRLDGATPTFVTFAVPWASTDPRTIPTRVRLKPNADPRIGLQLDANPIAGISLSTLRATRERPIFSPSRRPPRIKTPSPLVQTVSEGPSQPPFKLLGAIAADSRGIAIFMDQRSRKVIRMGIGESHFGWTLRNVKGRVVTLESNKRTVVVLTIPNPPAE
jgi:general secretion pathway protein N